jgi:thioredoxin
MHRQVVGNPIDLSPESFAELRRSGSPVVIDFWAPWCVPCRVQKPMVKLAAGQLGEQVTVAFANVDEVPEIAQEFGVRSIPAFVVIRGDHILDRWTGVLTPGQLTKRVLAAAHSA